MDIDVFTIWASGLAAFIPEMRSGAEAGGNPKSGVQGAPGADGGPQSMRRIFKPELATELAALHLKCPAAMMALGPDVVPRI